MPRQQPQVSDQERIDQLTETATAQRARVAALEADRVTAGTQVAHLRDSMERARASASSTPEQVQRLQAEIDAANAAYEQAVRTHGFAVEELRRIDTERTELATRTAEARFEEAMAAHLALCEDVDATVRAVFEQLDPKLDAYLESAALVARRERELKRTRVRAPFIQEERFPRLTWRLNVLMQATGRVEAAMQREREASNARARGFAEALDRNVHRVNAAREERGE
jgi:hypothetical protein